MISNLKITGNNSLMFVTTGIAVTYNGFYFWPVAHDTEDHSTQYELMCCNIAQLKEFGFFAKEDSEMKNWVMLPFSQNQIFTAQMVQFHDPLNNYGLMTWVEDPKNAISTEFSARKSAFLQKEGEGGILFNFNSQEEQIRAEEVFKRCKLKIFGDVKERTTFLPIKQYSNIRRIDIAVSCG